MEFRGPDVDLEILRALDDRPIHIEDKMYYVSPSSYEGKDWRELFVFDKESFTVSLKAFFEEGYALYETINNNVVHLLRATESRHRPDKRNYYLSIAEAVAKRGTCLRRNYGAVIVKNDEIIATGYTGAPRGESNCCDLKRCYRDEMNIPSGSNYELCRSVHAEMNAIISASRKDMQSATLYLVGLDAKTGEYLTSKPCLLCARMILNSGISRVIAKNKSEGYSEHNVPSRWLEWEPSK